MKIDVDKTDLNNVKSALSNVKNGAPRVISRSINKTLTSVKSMAKKEIAVHYNLTQKRIDKNFKVGKSSYAHLTGRVDSTGKPINLSSWVGTRQVKKGLSVKVLKKQRREVLTHAYIWTRKNKSGEEAKTAFSREWPRPRGSKLFKKWGISTKYAVLPRKYRLKIRRLDGPRLEDEYAKPRTIKKVEQYGSYRFGVVINQELDYEISKLK